MDAQASVIRCWGTPLQASSLQAQHPAHHSSALWLEPAKHGLHLLLAQAHRGLATCGTGPKEAWPEAAQFCMNSAGVCRSMFLILTVQTCLWQKDG